MAAAVGSSSWATFKPSPDQYAQEMENILGDLEVDVQVVLLPDLQIASPDLLEHLRTARLVIAVPTRLQEVRTLLESHGCRVVALACTVSTSTAPARRGRAEQRVGILVTYPEFLPTMLDEVSSFCLAQMPPAYALLGQDEWIQEMVAQIDVLVYASGSELALEWVPETVKTIELRHSPDPDSVRRLRPFLV